MKKKAILLITLLIITFSCKTNQKTTIDKKEDSICLFGLIQKKPLVWYLEKEKEIKSIKPQNKTSVFRKTYTAKNEQFLRTQFCNFKPLPAVNYIYNDNSKEIKEINYEWDIKNHLTQKEKSNIRIETKEKSEEYISHYRYLYDYLSQNIGKSIRQGSLDMDKNLNYEYLEITDKWETDKLSCELYMIFSNQHDKKGVMVINPTHRIRLKIEYK